MYIQPARKLLAPLPKRSRLAIAALIAALASLLAASTASATGSFHRADWLPGISLADLVDPDQDVTFESGDERLTFGNFSAEVSGIAPHRLDLYRVLPTEDGFKLFSPIYSVSGRSSELDLQYEVVVAEGFGIEAVSLSAFGAAAGRNTAAGVEALLASDGADAGALGAVLRGPFSFGRSSDELSLEGLLTHVALSEAIHADSEHGDRFHGGFAKVLATRRSFATAVAEIVPEVPEPTTLAMLSLGLAALAVRGRERRGRGQRGSGQRGSALRA